MRGPIDYIIVGFEGNKFDGSVLNALSDAVEKGVISVLNLALVMKDSDGNVTSVDISTLGDETIVQFTENHVTKDAEVSQEDIDEVGELLEKNTSAGLLVVEQLWAKPLKEALINANGVLLAEGRIHPEAAEELNSKED